MPPVPDKAALDLVLGYLSAADVLGAEHAMALVRCGEDGTVEGEAARLDVVQAEACVRLAAPWDDEGDGAVRVDFDTFELVYLLVQAVDRGRLEAAQRAFYAA